MAESYDMTTLSNVMNRLRKKGVEKEFNYAGGKFSLEEGGKTYAPADLLIIKTYRFEGESDPADNAALYLIETNDSQQGFIIDAYGAYTNHSGEGFDNALRSIPVHEREDQQIYGE